ncbi:ATPase domain-containing protein [Motilibacter aurantiacus]|uniref:ATPase domain-containing protein n=1 Tax=Motilibacter aurantiacus TaxID=2714955 RepID=UPI00140AD204|nr:AAA family ATPase [Motilibacter aurantiacus]
MTAPGPAGAQGTHGAPPTAHPSPHEQRGPAEHADPELARVETGIPGFDVISGGGLPRGRATLVSGEAGAAKTVFAAQFLAEGVRRGQPAVFVSLEEPADELRANLSTLGWPIADWERQELWSFVDASPVVVGESAEAFTDYSLETLAAQIGRAVDATGAVRLAIDSLDAVLLRSAGTEVVRGQLRRLVAELRRLGLTVVLTAETAEADPRLTLTGIGQFVADNVVVLRNRLQGERRRRTIEVLKMRGAGHRGGEHPFSVHPRRGVVVLPGRGGRPLPRPGNDRVPLGSSQLDELCGGGAYRGSVLLVAGPAASGKTLLAASFACAVEPTAGENGPVLFVACDRTREQVLHATAGAGYRLEAAERKGHLRFLPVRPEAPEEMLVAVQLAVEELAPARVVVDGLGAVQRAASEVVFAELVRGLDAVLRATGGTTLLTTSTQPLIGDPQDLHPELLAAADGVLLLRHLDLGDRLARTVAVLGVRGGPAGHQVCELLVDAGGLRLVPLPVPGRLAAGPGAVPGVRRR